MFLSRKYRYFLAILYFLIMNDGVNGILPKNIGKIDISPVDKNPTYDIFPKGNF